MASSNFAVNDHKWHELRRRLSTMTKQLRVGIFDDETLAERAKIHEYGTATVPMRSFLRPGIRVASDGVKEIIRKSTGRVLAGRQSIESMLRKMGDHTVATIQGVIWSNVPPPLAASTIKRKGHDIALIETGAMFDAITFRITE